MNLANAQVAVLAENQYQELELWYPLLRLRETGANVVVVAPAAGQTYASKLGYPVRADIAATEVRAADLDAAVIPGGFAPEGMRRHPAMVGLVRDMRAQGGLVAAICHYGGVPRAGGARHGGARQGVRELHHGRTRRRFRRLTRRDAPAPACSDA
jgi:protease I